VPCLDYQEQQEVLVELELLALVVQEVPEEPEEPEELHNQTHSLNLVEEPVAWVVSAEWTQL
jgi:hypothetical protein